MPVVSDRWGVEVRWFHDKTSHAFPNSRLWSSGSSPACIVRSRCTIGATTYPSAFGIRCDENGSIPPTDLPLPASTDDHGRLRSNKAVPRLKNLAITQARLYIEPSPPFSSRRVRPVTQSIATPEPRRPGPHPRSSRSSLRPWLCHHTREPAVLSRVSCRPTPEHWPFSPALPVTLALSHPRTTWRPLTLAGSPVLPPWI